MIKGFEDFYFIYLQNRQNVATTKIGGTYPLRRTEERWKIVLKKVKDILN